MSKREEELKSLLMKVKEERGIAGLKLNIKTTTTTTKKTPKIMASSPITSWKTEGEKRKSGTNFLILVSKITVDGNCSCEIRRQLLLGRRAMTNLDSVLKNRDIAH